MKVKTIVIGYGFLGKWHAQKAAALKESCELVAIIETYEPNIQKAQADHPGVKVLSHWQDIKADFDAAVIVTPTSLHHDVAMQLLKAGKHVFCEKPLASTTQQSKEIDALAQEKKLTLQVGHSERCHEAWEKLSEYFKSIEKDAILRINRYAPFKGRATDVDVVQDLMIHDIDLVLWLTGKDVVSVSAWGQKIRTNYWDHVTAELRLKDGITAFITVGRNHVEEERSLEVCSRKGLVKVDLFRNTISHAPADQISEGIFTQTETYAKRDHLLIEQTAFYASVLQRKAPMVSGRDGVRAVELVEAVLSALETRSTVKIYG